MRGKVLTRRRFLLASILCAPFLAVGDAKWIEPGWVKLHRLNFAKGKATHRIVQLSDVHHKGDRAYFQSVVKSINALSPDFVCFTGDLIEEGKYLPAAHSNGQGLEQTQDAGTEKLRNSVTPCLSTSLRA